MNTHTTGVRLLLFIFISTLCPSLRAQQLTNATPSRSEYYQRESQKTYQLAAQKGWPLQINRGNNQVLILQRTDALGEPVYYSTHSSPISLATRTDALYTGGSLGLNLNGGNPAIRNKIALWDGGKARPDHRELTGKVQQNDLPTSQSANDHATHMAGIMVGKGVYQNARGMAFGANLKAWDFTNDLSEITVQAPTLLISNHAYGPLSGWVLNTARPGTSNDDKWEWWGTPSVHGELDYRFGFYDDAVSEIDRITHNFPYFLMVRSADNKRSENGPPAGTKYFLKNTTSQSTIARSRNASYDIIPGEANAKNVLTIGSADPDSGSFKVSPYSGWGPTDDGRIKPDLLGIGTNVLSSIGTDVDAYGVLSGTSMASANVSGSLLLVQELYYQQKGFFMLASTLKGLALHTANKPTGITAPSYEYGWGLLNTEKAAQVVLNQNGSHLLTEQVLQRDGSITLPVIAAGNEPLMVTICWTDPEGLPTTVSNRNVDSRSPKLINDLDLKIQERFNAYQPWVLDPAAPAQAAKTGDNIRDNVEQIYIPNPLKGRTYIVTVSHKNLLKNNRQPFSLIASGIESTDCESAVTISPTQDTTLCAGQTLTLTAKAGSSFTYEWFLNGTLVKKGSDRTLNTTSTGQYSVRVSNQGCSAQSKVINVRSTNLFASIIQGTKLLVCNNEGTELTANGGSGYQYQWLLNGTPVEGATSSRHQATQSGSYRVVINFQGCSAVSSGTELEIKSANATVTPAVSATICNGNPANLNVASQTGATYTWYFDNNLVTGATGTSFPALNPGHYSVEVRNGACLEKSKDVLVQRVNVAATITPSESTRIRQGDSLTFRVSYAKGNLYEWYRNSKLIGKDATGILTVGQDGEYKVIVENSGCRAETPTVVVQLENTPAALPVGISDLSDTLSTMVVYPNPSHEVVAVAFRKPRQGSNPRVSILSMNGVIILTQPMAEEGIYLTAKLDLKTLPAGPYLIKVTLGTRSITEHFVKR